MAKEHARFMHRIALPVSNSFTSRLLNVVCQNSLMKNGVVSLRVTRITAVCNRWELLNKTLFKGISYQSYRIRQVCLPENPL